ncbi:MAG: hypothetical protein KDA42_18535 [Planctomycetales bacterium]|nr:hypothetical protein [Planctomycetales bacterium]
MSRPMFPVPKDAQATGASDVKWFAGLAMQAMIAKQEIVPDSEAQREEIALWSFRMAQAMVVIEKRIRADSSD